LDPAQADRRDDEELVLTIFTAPPGEAESVPRRIRLLEIVRNHRTGSVDLHLPERNEIVSTGWVPEIGYEVTPDGYRITATIRPDVAPFLQKQQLSKEAVEAKSASRKSEPADDPPLPLKPTGTLPENVPHSADDVLYEVTLHNREIRVNGFRLSRPNFNSENELVFEYLFRNANRRVDLTEIEATVGRPLAKKLREVVRDLGFRDELKEMFFPGISKTAIVFVNPVTKAEFEARELQCPQLDVR
jgi:hypothetical protein